MIRIRWGSRILSLELRKIRCKFARRFSTIRSKIPLFHSMEIDNGNWYTIKILSFEFIEMEGRFTLQKRV